MTDPTPMDWIRAALANASHEGLTTHDLTKAAEHATTARDFDRAVNWLVRATQG